MNINIFNTEDEVLEKLALYFVSAAKESIAEHGKFSVVLSGGNSPKKLYQLLASVYKEKVEWQKVDFFFGDERYVPQTDKDSNFLMAKKALFDPLQIKTTQIFPVDTLPAPDKSAEEYSGLVNNYFSGNDISFDLILLGLGDNSHTASLFPHTPVLHDTSAAVKSVFLEDQQVYRITFTAPLINQAFRIAFLVYGHDKAAAVAHVIQDSRNIENFPAQLITPQKGELQWFIDKAAAANLVSPVS